MSKDLIVIVPGISGSILQKDGKTVWGPSGGAIWRILARHGLDGLRIDHESSAQDLGDGVTVAGIIPDMHVLPGLWKIDGYSGFGQSLANRLGRAFDDGIVYFPYDWRRDNRVSAAAFAAKVLPELHGWRQKVGSDAKLTIVAHSMGGLVARYFIECLDGWRDTRQLITLGTPFRGSLAAVGFLGNGYAKRIGPISIDATSVLRSFSSVYQLLPTYECIDDGSGSLRAVDDLALLNFDPAKVADARAFHDEIQTAAERNAREEGYAAKVTPLLSSTQPTFQTAKVAGEGVELAEARNGKDEGGDGTVPMISAIPRGKEVADGFFVKGVHASLQGTDPALEFSVGQINAGGTDLGALRSAPTGGDIRLWLDDAYAANRPFQLLAEVRQATESKLTAAAFDPDTQERVNTTLWPDGSGKFRSEMTLKPGAWRLTVTGERSPAVTDVMLVVDGSDAA